VSSISDIYHPTATQCAATAMSAINEHPTEGIESKEKKEYAADGLEAGDGSDTEGALSFTALIEEGGN
jgi:hypothetical protein